MGLPVHRFVAAANVNDVLPEYLHTGRLRVRPAIRTLSNAMDVGNPGNFARLEALFGSNCTAMREVVHGSAWSDAATLQTIRDVYDTFGYVLDPHAAVAFRAWREFEESDPGDHRGIVLATAHPAKFLEAYEARIRAAIEIPVRLSERMGMRKLSIRMSSGFEEFKAFLSETGKAGQRP
jgi:threonine synthase